jgi:hypothetical protein
LCLTPGGSNPLFSEPFLTPTWTSEAPKLSRPIALKLEKIIFNLIHYFIQFSIWINKIKVRDILDKLIKVTGLLKWLIKSKRYF